MSIKNLLFAFLVCAMATSANAREGANSLTLLIEKYWKDLSNGKAPQVPFSVSVVMAPDSEDLFAVQSPVPKTDETYANSHIRLACIDKQGVSIPTRKPNEKGPKYFTISASLRDLQVTTDTGAYETNALPQFAIMIENCDIKDRATAPIEAIIERNLALMNTKALYPGPTFTCPDLNKCGPLAQVIIAEGQSAFQLGLADIALVQPYQVLRHAKPDDQKALREQASRFAQSAEKSCKLPKKFQPDEVHGNLIGTDKYAQCIKDAYNKQRSIWLEQVQTLLNPDALAEVTRPAREHYELQLLLAYHGFLPTDAKIEGSYGAGTRAAITALQKEAQLEKSGFLSNKTAEYLQKKPDNTK